MTAGEFARAAMAAVGFDQPLAAEWRVRRSGDGWQVVIDGNDSIFPGIFGTQDTALAAANMWRARLREGGA